jgi:hypothetical protein
MFQVSAEEAIALAQPLGVRSTHREPERSLRPRRQQKHAQTGARA